jgi:hypothetical protein
MQDGSSPIYTLRGARPRPAPTMGPSRGAMRSTALLAVVMIGWMLVVLALAAIFSPGGLAGNGSIPVGRGVAIINPGGWASAPNIWRVGPNAVSLQKAGAVVTFAAEAYTAGVQQLSADGSSFLQSQFSSLRSLPAAADTIAGDVPALITLFSGSQNSSLLEGELVVAVRGGTGVVMLAVAPAGQLRRVQGDLDQMLNTMSVPQ